MSAGQDTIAVIDATWDKRPAYRLGADCTNCGWEGEYMRAHGVEPQSMISCPRCGCSTVRAHRKDFRGTNT